MADKSSPMAGAGRGFDPSKATLLGGTEAPPEQIDLSKPIDEQLWRKATLSLLGSVAASLETLAFHAERAMPLTVNGVTKIGEALDQLSGKFDAFGVIDEQAPEGSKKPEPVRPMSEPERADHT